jgi:hypothetical protein
LRSCEPFGRKHVTRENNATTAKDNATTTDDYITTTEDNATITATEDNATTEDNASTSATLQQLALFNVTSFKTRQFQQRHLKETCSRC